MFDTEHLSPLFERVIVATGTSNRQTKAIASSVRDAVKKAGFAIPRHEGEASGEWIIVDCNQAVVHIMQPAIRQYYRLEEIWVKSPCASNWAVPSLPNAPLRKMPAEAGCHARQEAQRAQNGQHQQNQRCQHNRAEPKASTTKPRAGRAPAVPAGQQRQRRQKSPRLKTP